MATYDELEDKYRELCESDTPLDVLITRLHEEGVGFMDTLKLLMNTCGMSLGDAKQKVMGHPAWSRESARANRLHDEIEKALEEEDVEKDV